jgi:WD40 repeat protein
MSHRLIVALLIFGVVLNSGRLARSEPPASEQTKRTDRYGDPLPEGAIARLGTLRLRHCSQVTSVAYSPDGRLLATGGFDNQVRLWRASTGKELFHFTLRETDSPLAAHVAFSPDGTLLAASRSGEGVVHLWDTATGKERKGCSVPNEENIGGITFSPDGKILAGICWAHKGGRRTTVSISGG